MKQHITWDQFTQLSYKQVSKLQILINQRYHLIEDEKHWDEVRNHTYTFDDGTISNIHTSYIGFLKKLNIGKMIEIINNVAHLEFDIRKNFDPISECFINWSVEISGYKTVDSGFEVIKTSSELCDALWEAIKLILQKCHKLT